MAGKHRVRVFYLQDVGEPNIYRSKFKLVKISGYKPTQPRISDILDDKAIRNIVSNGNRVVIEPVEAWHDDSSAS